MATFDCSLGRMLTPEEEAALPPEPRPTVALRKLRMWDRAKAIRDNKISGGVTVTGIGRFQSDDLSLRNINGAATAALLAQAAGQPFAMTWTLANNSDVALDGETMATTAQAVAQHIASCHDRARALRDAIQAATTHVELDAIDLTAGWP